MNGNTCKCAAAAFAAIGLTLFAAGAYLNVDLKYAASACMLAVLGLALRARPYGVNVG